MQDESKKGMHAGLAKVKGQAFDPLSITRYQVELSPSEKKVLLQAKRLMKKHYVLDTQDLYLQAIEEIHDEAPDAIHAAIRGLLSKNILFDGAAMTKDDVLVNETRHRVFETICLHPGIHFSTIRGLVNTDSRSLLVHLSVLERFGFVRLEHVNTNKACYEASLPRDLDIFFYYMQNDHARCIFKAIVDNQPVGMDELNAILKDSMSSQVLARRVKILMDHKLISGKYEGNKLVSLAIPSKYKNLIKNQLSNA